VAQHVTSTEPLLGVLHQELLDQILGLGGDISPFLGMEFKLALLNVVEEVYLAVVAGASASAGL